MFCIRLWWAMDDDVCDVVLGGRLDVMCQLRVFTQLRVGSKLFRLWAEKTYILKIYIPLNCFIHCN